MQANYWSYRRFATDTLKNYLIENSKPYKNRNKNGIIKLRYEIRESFKLLEKIYLGTLIIAQLKAKIDNIEVLQSSK